ncbi:purine nucleoside permease [Tothia fuscella]|uniref:Purine nucleoside permease n=1 Tax=Tothia fuscella TaxID=1048955 RepID=A0A9P4NEU9_9PEZI|nr:purine nucleoside permease [Tothia fuscella]
MFDPEADVWYGIEEFDLFEQNITLPGLSPLFPDVHCTATGEVCQFTIGESEINAATSVMSLVLSPKFNFTNTYWMVAGIGGINPEVATICSVTFARYAVQVALQYEFDTRELPDNFTTGYVPFGATAPDQYPKVIYGTEVFEVNQALQELAIGWAKTATLNDSADAVAYRANYASDEVYAAATAPPSVLACDVATSDVYYSGALLGEAFGNLTTLMTNGSGVYCSTAQEDNATLEAMVRAATAGLVDYSRIIIMRTASDFDRQYPGQEAYTNLFYANQGAFLPAIANIYLAGIKVVEGILGAWDTYEGGVATANYLGDIFGTLGGTPDFGPAPSSTMVGKRSLDATAADMTRGMMTRRQERAGIKIRMD